ncbi:unnamed protein product [Rotaria magnacalcarata]|uniref:BZIP domain-containing protein n=1 Tax=Rotaria magnacalcarata TaxID=392030 RepID=A0A816RF64_9BILA|nr:unnamed protein product [Rotaria magnacalcarata]
MSFIKHPSKFIQPGKIEHIRLSSKPNQDLRLGKTDHDYRKIHQEIVEEFEIDGTRRQQDNVKTLSTAATNAAIMKIESELKLLCSLQVLNSDESSSNIINRDVNLSSLSNQTTLEPSTELPIEDTILLEELINNSQFSKLDNDWIDSLTLEPIDQAISSDHNMTYTELPDMSMEQNEEYLQDTRMTESIPSTSYDDRNSSVGSVSDDNERDDINRRGLKKSGGPVRKLARFGNKQVIKYSDEYHDRRIKNNDAVKKSRMKAKEKQKETEQKMKKLADENRTLNDRVDLLMKELHVLKSLYKELNQELPAGAVRELQRANVH